MKISVPVSFILIIALSAFCSCKKNLADDVQAIEDNDPRLFIKNWQQQNDYRSEVSLKNFEHKIVFEWDNKFLYENTWFVPSAAIAGDSFHIYRFLQYPADEKDKKKKNYFIKYLLVPTGHMVSDPAQLVEEAVMNPGAIQSFTSAIYPDTAGSGTEKNGSVLAVRKSKNTINSLNPPIPEGCEIVAIDWYWQHFENGVLMWEEYLFTTNEIVCEGGGGGGGGGGDTLRLNNPCDSVAKLDSNAEFKAKLDTLKNKANGNREYCYVYKNTTSTTIEETMSWGEQDSLGTDYSLASTEKIDGMMHNHFFLAGRSVSIFSDADLLDLIKLYKEGNISDPYTFTLTLTSQHGRQYMLKINDLTKFIGFVQLYQNDFVMMSTMQMYGVVPDQTGFDFSSLNEVRFLKFLEKTNSGLKLFKANSTSGGWDPIKRSENGGLIGDPCN